MATPDEHIATLDGLARVFELVVRTTRVTSVEQRDTVALCQQRAAAIRWILAETAYPLIDGMVTDDAAD